jgi:hypothetical protein
MEFYKYFLFRKNLLLTFVELYFLEKTIQDTYFIKPQTLKCRNGYNHEIYTYN